MQASCEHNRICGRCWFSDFPNGLKEIEYWSCKTIGLGFGGINLCSPKQSGGDQKPRHLDRIQNYRKLCEKYVHLGSRSCSVSCLPST